MKAKCWWYFRRLNIANELCQKCKFYKYKIGIRGNVNDLVETIHFAILGWCFVDDKDQLDDDPHQSTRKLVSMMDWTSRP